MHTKLTRAGQSLEGNMGIMVACAPTLKRLFRSWLKLGSTQKSHGYTYGARSEGADKAGSAWARRSRHGGGPTTNRDHTGYIKTSDEEHSETDGLEMHDYNDAHAKEKKDNGFTVTAYHVRPETHNGSQERILERGIVKTTEFRVQPV
jgi:hypothetical protein